MNMQDVTVATISGEPYGYKRALRLTVDVRIETESSDREAETTDHRKVRGVETFALSWGIWYGPHMVSGGQSDPSEFKVKEFANGMTAEKLAALVALHERYHLNTLKAGCIHQTSKPPTKRGPYGHAVIDLDAVPACPQTGYKYGHAWLVEELPAGFMAALEACLPNV